MNKVFIVLGDKKRVLGIFTNGSRARQRFNLRKIKEFEIQNVHQIHLAEHIKLMKEGY